MPSKRTPRAGFYYHPVPLPSPAVQVLALPAARLLPRITPLLLCDNEEAVIEAARVYGNFSRSPEVRDYMQVRLRWVRPDWPGLQAQGTCFAPDARVGCASHIINANSFPCPHGPVPVDHPHASFPVALMLPTSPQTLSSYDSWCPLPPISQSPVPASPARLTMPPRSALHAIPPSHPSCPQGARVIEALVLLLDHGHSEVVYSVCGTLINFTMDAGRKGVLAGLGGGARLVEVLSRTVAQVGREGREAREVMGPDRLSARGTGQGA